MTREANLRVLGELESEVMEIVWTDQKPVSVREVTNNLQKKRKIAYTTVMTIMGRLVDKGLLKRKQFGKAYLYQSAYSKDKFLTRVTSQIIKNFISNFGDVAVAHFVEEIDKLSPEKRKQLRKFLKDSQKK